MEKAEELLLPVGQKSMSFGKFCSGNSIAVAFNIFGGVESQGCIPVVRGTPVHVSAQES